MDEIINKVYDLLELVYLELQKTKIELQDGFDKSLHSQRYELKTDMADLRTELKADMEELRTEFKTDMSNLRTEFKTDMTEFRQEVNTRFDRLEHLVNKHDVEIRVIKAAK